MFPHSVVNVVRDVSLLFFFFCYVPNRKSKKKMCSMDTLSDANPPDIAHDGQIADVSPGNQVGPSSFPAIR